MKIDATAKAEAEAIRIRVVAEATSESIRKVNQAIKESGDAYFRYRQIEMLPEIAPVIAEALAKARMISINGGGEGSAPESVTNNIASVIQTVLAAQMVA